MVIFSKSFLKFIALFGLVVLLVVGCSQSKEQEVRSSTHPLSAYFYPQDSVPVVYLYRNIANGLEEQFHRVYSIDDSEGEHIVVEIYTADGRIIEALNYNVDSLDLMDHMVVGRDGTKRKAELLKNKIFPTSTSEKTWFASRFPGFLDSTLILNELRRNLNSDKSITVDFQGDKLKCIQMDDYNLKTLFNPFTKKESTIEGKSITIFAAGIGIYEWYDVKKSVHFRLERILPQEEWIKMIVK